MHVNKALAFDDVLLIPNYNHYESRRMVDISKKAKLCELKLALPVMTSNMDTITEHRMANFIGEKGGLGALHRFMSIERNVEEFKKCQHPTMVSIGCSEEELERAKALYDSGATYFCLDVAHAHAKYVGKTLKALKQILKNVCLVAGNVATYAGADFLASCGADLIKVGIGGGSVCTTRVKTGFGMPSLTSIHECAKVDRSIIADGGLRTPGDIVKALAFGADYVMLGGMFAGTRPTPGDIIEKNGQRFKEYRGMASYEAQKNFHGHMHEWKTAEGAALLVPYTENEEAIVADIIGGLRSGLTYGGAATISELQRKASYTEVTSSGRKESLAHKLLD